MRKFNVGDVFADHYQLKKRLGAGSFGEVWLAQNLLADIEVAIKFYGLLDKKGIDDFREEFKIAYKLQHPNLLHLNHFDIFENSPYLIMPYCSRGSSASLIGKMNEKQIWQFIRDVSRGLMFLHSQEPPIIHQDIKPDNILIGDDGRFMISDFGISRKLGHTFRKGNSKYDSSGTLAYMGPEHFSTTPLSVATSDIWALGMSVYELINGRVLWEGIGGCAQLNGAQIPPLNGLSPQLTQFVNSCLSVNTWDRPTAQKVYQLACNMVNQDYSYLNKIQERYTPAPERVAVSSMHQPQTAPPKKISVNQNERFWKKNRNIIAASVGGMILFVLCIVGIISLAGNNKEEQRYRQCETELDYREFINDFPYSPYVPLAKEQIKNIKYKDVQPDKVGEEVYFPLPEKNDTIPMKQQVTDNPISILVGQKNNSSRKTNKKCTEENDKKIKDKENTEYQIFKNCSTVTQYEKYLKQYPNGKYIHKAKRRIQEIETGMMQRNNNNNRYKIIR